MEQSRSRRREHLYRIAPVQKARIPQLCNSRLASHISKLDWTQPTTQTVTVCPSSAPRTTVALCKSKLMRWPSLNNYLCRKLSIKNGLTTTFSTSTRRCPCPQIICIARSNRQSRSGKIRLSRYFSGNKSSRWATNTCNRLRNNREGIKSTWNDFINNHPWPSLQLKRWKRSRSKYSESKILSWKS